ncbi:hypothetical protein A2U01_0067413, partial [Trifolium medium]|nr:hypothetical protein [Trifolium medium]
MAENKMAFVAVMFSLGIMLLIDGSGSRIRLTATLSV